MARLRVIGRVGCESSRAHGESWANANEIACQTDL